MSLPARPEDVPDSIARKANDEENHSQTSTLNRIQTMRDHLADYQVMFAQSEFSHDISREQQVRSYHQMAQGLLQIIKQYLVDKSFSGNTGESSYWTTAPIAEFDIQPPDVITTPSHRDARKAVRNGDATTAAQSAHAHTAETRVVRVTGLREYDQLEADYQVEWTMMFGPKVDARTLRKRATDTNVTIHDRTHPHEPIKITKRGTIPKQVVDNAITTMEKFIRELGMDIEFTGEDYMGEGGPGV